MEMDLVVDAGRGITINPSAKDRLLNKNIKVIIDILFNIFSPFVLSF